MKELSSPVGFEMFGPLHTHTEPSSFTKERRERRVSLFLREKRVEATAVKSKNTQLRW